MGLQDVMEAAGCGWMLKEELGDPAMRLEHYRVRLAEVLRLQGEARPAEDIGRAAEIVKDNPHRLTAIFQALWCDMSPALILAAWRIACGWDIETLLLDYVRPTMVEGRVTEPGRCVLSLIVREHGGSGRQEYTGGTVGDLSFLRHVGVLELAKQVVLDGYYPLR